MEKRSKFAVFIDVSATSTPDWALLGEGITTASINYNPQTSEETYIHQDSGTTEIESYKPTLPIECSFDKGDAALAYLDTLRKSRAVLDDAVRDALLVYLYEDAVSGAYPAEKQSVSIQIDSFGGDGGGKIKINSTLNFRGDAIDGTFNPTTGTFTAA